MIDLHTHSIFSDGTDTPEELVALGEAAGLSALALTDHDTLEGLPRFLACQARTPLRLIPGIELSCRFLGRELHILGLFVNPDDRVFQARLQHRRHQREARNAALLERLAALGLPVDWERIHARAPGGLVSRTHFALALAERGYVATPQEAFQRYLSEGAPAHVPLEELQPRTAATWIREAGGVAALAHPGRFHGGRFIWDQALVDLKEQGIQAIEVYYSEHAPQQEQTFLALAQRLGLAPCGGSDYHGKAKPGLTLGRGWGNLRVPRTCLEALESLRSIHPASMEPIEVHP